MIGVEVAGSRNKENGKWDLGTSDSLSPEFQKF